MSIRIFLRWNRITIDAAYARIGHGFAHAYGWCRHGCSWPGCAFPSETP